MSKNGELSVPEQARICFDAMYNVMPTVTTGEAIAYRERLDRQLDELAQQGIAPHFSSDFLDAAGRYLPVYPDGTEPLELDGEALSLRKIRRHLTPDERRWFNRMIMAHGERAVLNMWPSLQAQLNFSRNL